MARKKDYWELIAQHIAAVVESRKIEDVLHFTRLENLPSILEHGLQSRLELRDADHHALASDATRLDKEDGAISVSISCFYPKMFSAKRYRAGHKPWVILVLHPSLLWNLQCRFYRNGAATNATKHQSGKMYGGFALQKLFEDCPSTSERTTLRKEYDLQPSWPTYPDSEVQVMNPIHPHYIVGAWVETPANAEYVQVLFENAGRNECVVVVRPFTARISREPHCWG